MEQRQHQLSDISLTETHDVDTETYITILWSTGVSIKNKKRIYFDRSESFFFSKVNPMLTNLCLDYLQTRFER